MHIGQPVDTTLDGSSIAVSVTSLNSLVISVGLAFYQQKTIKAYEISGSAFDPSTQVTSNILTVKNLLTPLAREEIKVVRCLGLNYSDHAVGRFDCGLLRPGH